MLNDRIGENIPIISISKNLPKKCTFHISHGRKPFWTPNQVGNGENVETVVSRHGIFGCNLGWVCDGNSMESASFVADFVWKRDWQVVLGERQTKDIWNIEFMGLKRADEQNRIHIWAKKSQHQTFHISLLPHGIFVDHAKRCELFLGRRGQVQLPWSHLVQQRFGEAVHVPTQSRRDAQSFLVWESHSESAGCGEEWTCQREFGVTRLYLTPNKTSCITILMKCWLVSKYHSSGLASRKSWWVHLMTLIGCFWDCEISALDKWNTCREKIIKP